MLTLDAPSAVMHAPLARPPVVRLTWRPRPLKHQPKQVQSVAMTVCIAGICMDKGRPRFVLCSDQRIETEQSGGDVCLKMDHAGDGWAALIAGSPARARDLVAVCRNALGSRTHLMGSAEYVSEISACASKQKRTLVEAYVQSQLGVSYEYFLEYGQVRLPERHFDEIMTGVRSIDLGCDVILAGFIGDDPFLLSIDRYGMVYREESFAAIGSGASNAQASLFRRAYRGYMPLDEAAYYIYEAKKFSEVSPGVGPSTTMAVIGKSPQSSGFSRWKHADPFCMARLENEYKQFGPQPYIASGWPEGFGSLAITEGQSTPELTIHDPLSLPPSQE